LLLLSYLPWLLGYLDNIMNIKNINLTTISNSSITILYPFEYDKDKVLRIDTKKIVKLKNETLKDFLPYTKNFFGTYHFEENKPSNIIFPMVYANDKITSIDFIKDKKIIDTISLSDTCIYFFEKSIAILAVRYDIPENLSNEDFLYYHQKLSMIEKRSKQNIITSTKNEYKYYYEFIDSLVAPYTNNTANIFSRSNLYTYNLLVANTNEKDNNTQSFIEPLLQYRNTLDTISINQTDISYIQQVSNIHTFANENVVAHIGIRKENSNNNFINNEFFNKYQNNHFLTYLITLYQTCKIEQLIIKAFLEEDADKDLKNIREIKSEILHFIANGDFTKISNNSIRNNLYKFYRNNFEIKNMLNEIQTISDKLSNELETIIQDKKATSDEKRNLFIGIIGVVLAVIQIYQAF